MPRRVKLNWWTQQKFGIKTATLVAETEKGKKPDLLCRLCGTITNRLYRKKNTGACVNCTFVIDSRPKCCSCNRRVNDLMYHPLSHFYIHIACKTCRNKARKKYMISWPDVLDTFAEVA